MIPASPARRHRSRCAHRESFRCPLPFRWRRSSARRCCDRLRSDSSVTSRSSLLFADRERAEVPKRLESARSWMQARRNVTPRAALAAAVPVVGDLLNLNVNARDFCANPDLRTGRVAAVTDKAIVVSDTANPPGGFTDADYRSIGVTFDTLIDPVDRGAFGAVTDIDNNGHVILFFTRAVNEATAAGSSSVVLGYFYREICCRRRRRPARARAATSPRCSISSCQIRQVSSTPTSAPPRRC